MIKRNKTMAKVMVVALCANTIAYVNVFASEQQTKTAEVTVEDTREGNIKQTIESNVEQTTGAEVLVGTEVADEKDFEFDDETGTILKYKCIGKEKSKRIVIPNKIHGVDVVAIGDEAFSEGRYPNKNIEEVVLPETIKKIDDNAFEYCCSLKRINLPEGLTEIGSYAFSSCGDLKEVKFPESLDKIGEAAFISCKEIKSIELPGNLTSIGKCAFEYCSNLKSVTVPDSVTYIGKLAFSDIDSHAIINVTSSDVYCLVKNSCVYEKNIAFSGEVKASQYDFQFDKKTGTILKYVGIRSKVNIPDKIQGVDVTGINKSFLENDRKSYIEEVILPENLKRIEDNTFGGCKNLKKINLPDSLNYIGVEAFQECSKLKKVTIPGSVTKINQATFKGCTNLSEIKLENGVSTIDYGAFEDCPELNSVYIPDTLISVKYDSFSGNSKTKYYVTSQAVADLLEKECMINKDKIVLIK